MNKSIENEMFGWDNYIPRKWLSPSSLVAFKRCPFYFFLSSGCRLSSGESDHPALAFGEAIHAAAPIALQQNGEAAYAEFYKIWGEFEADDKRNNISAKRILDHLAQSSQILPYYLVEPPFPVLNLPTKVSKWEVPFWMDIGAHLPIVGRMDGLGRLKLDNSLVPIEYKTTSETSPRFFTAFSFSPQLLTYMLYLRTVVKEPVNCAILQALRVSKTNADSSCQLVYIQSHVLESHLNWMRKVAAEIKWCEDNHQFPKDFSGCHPYAQFGNPGYPCSYENHCQLEDWTQLKDSLRKREEHPFDLTVGGKAVSQIVKENEKNDQEQSEGNPVCHPHPLSSFAAPLGVELTVPSKQGMEGFKISF